MIQWSWPWRIPWPCLVQNYLCHMFQNSPVTSAWDILHLRLMSISRENLLWCTTLNFFGLVFWSMSCKSSTTPNSGPWDSHTPSECCRMTGWLHWLRSPRFEKNTYKQMTATTGPETVTCWFPEIGVPPVLIHFRCGCSIINHLAIKGYPEFSSFYRWIFPS